VDTMTSIVYLDVDSDRKTGRQMGEKDSITGTDVMLTLSAGKASFSLHGVDVTACGDGKLRYAVNGSSLYFCADLPIKATPAGAEFGIFMLAHQNHAGRCGVWHFHAHAHGGHTQPADD
jgi:hypothetical protein